MSDAVYVDPSAHRVKWFGVIAGAAAHAANQADNPGSYAWHGDLRVPRNRHMHGGDWGWDVVCSCGWDSRTGGAIQERVREAITEHKWDVSHGYA